MTGYWDKPGFIGCDGVTTFDTEKRISPCI